MEKEWFCVEQAAMEIGLSLKGLRRHIHAAHVQSVIWSDIPKEGLWYGPEGRMRRWYIHRGELERFAATTFQRRLRNIPDDHSVVDLVYLAAMIDGEGSISLHKQRPKHRENWSWSYTVIVQITNTDRRLIDWLSDTFAGYVNFRSMREVNPRWKDRYGWFACSSYGYHVLKLARPYLKLKGEQADLVTEFYEGNYNLRAPSRAKISDEENERRARIAARLHELNANGPPCQNSDQRS